MSRYDVIGRMNACFVELEQALSALQQQITPLRLLAARVFSLPEVEKGQEHQAISHIAVEQHVGQAARDLALEHYQRLFIHHNRENVSSKAAVRLPGVICLTVEQPEYQALQAQLALINRLKGELEQIITVDSGLAPEQRFEFVHADRDPDYRAAAGAGDLYRHDAVHRRFLRRPLGGQQLDWPPCAPRQRPGVVAVSVLLLRRLQRGRHPRRRVLAQLRLEWRSGVYQPDAVAGAAGGALPETPAGSRSSLKRKSRGDLPRLVLPVPVIIDRFSSGCAGTPRPYPFAARSDSVAGTGWFPPSPAGSR